MDDVGLHAVIQECGFLLIQHLMWHPDCHLLQEKKWELSGRHFDSNDDDVIAALDHFLEAHDADFSKEEIHVVHNCWTKSVSAGGDHVQINVL